MARLMVDVLLAERLASHSTAGCSARSAAAAFGSNLETCRGRRAARISTQVTSPLAQLRRGCPGLRTGSRARLPLGRPVQPRRSAS